LARVIGSRLGWPAMRTVMLPYPLTERTDDELRQIADAYTGALLEAIGLS
jgi:hypothetical protein